MRILLASYYYPPSVGGVERHSQLLATGLAARGHRVRVVTAQLAGAPRVERAGGALVERISPGTGSRWRKMGTYIAALLASTLRMRREIDLIHVQQALYPASAMAVASALLRLPLVVCNHGSGYDGAVGLMSRLPLGRLGLHLIRSRAVCVAVSRESADELTEAGFRHVVHIPNGVPVGPEVTDEQRQTARHTLGVEGFTTLYVGRLDDQKNVELLVRAWKALRLERGTLLIVGDGPNRAGLEQLAGERDGGNTRIRFIGGVSDVRPYLEAADLFVLPSRSEGMPLALLEAMAAGLPVIATDVGGNREVLAQDDVGALVPPNNAAALSAMIVDLALSPAKRSVMGQRARHHILERYSADAVVAQYERLYRTVLAK